MGYLINGYKILAQEISDRIVEHRAGIGTAVSVGGTILSNILSTKAGAKSARMIDAKANELGRDLTLKEKVKLVWTNHIGSAATAGISCIGAGYSHNQHVKDFNKVATAYAGVKRLYDTTKTATREVLGEKKNTELQDKINQKTINSDPEMKKKVAAMPPNPDPEHMQRFVETHTGEIIWSTKDKIVNAIKIMALELKAMHHRERSGWNYRGKYGIPVSRFFELAEHELPKEKKSAPAFNDGWNKGCEDDGSDDDKIAAIFTPMLIGNDENFSAIAINWEQEPSDLSLGDYMKS